MFAPWEPKIATFVINVPPLLRRGSQDIYAYLYVTVFLAFLYMKLFVRKLRWVYSLPKYPPLGNYLRLPQLRALLVNFEIVIVTYDVLV